MHSSMDAHQQQTSASCIAALYSTTDDLSIWFMCTNSKQCICVLRAFNAVPSAAVQLQPALPALSACSKLGPEALDANKA